MHHIRRRKKQRPNYGKRIVDVCRSVNGFGFTISGQQPCILSCIVPQSPADMAGLRAGDFLISVNGSNVSKLPHEVVVQLINNSIGTIRLAIAENYYSDSSDEEGQNPYFATGGIHDAHQRTRRPKYPHHKMKMNRAQQQNRKKYDLNESSEIVDGKSKSVNRSDVNYVDEPLASSMSSAHNIIHSPNASNERDITNVSAMVPPIRSNEIIDEPDQCQLEYRTVVGYLGTIEMPKQIATSSKLQTVRSCIRKMRQEKRQPTVVLMQILPTCLKLYNSENVLIAKYPAGRLSYVSSNNNSNAVASTSGMAESDMRFFGLVTSAAYADGQICDWTTNATDRSDVIVSNSCHVFVIDLKLIDHSAHFDRAEQFSIVCTKDPVTNCCLEFPSSSEYVVNLIRSMYALNSIVPPTGLPKSLRSVGINKILMLDGARQLNHPLNNGGGNSPQPSNHSEITTASSNSDSGIGFHNDFTNISDRILVVDFPGNNALNSRQNHLNFRIGSRLNGRPVPFGADSIRNIRSTTDHPSVDTAPAPNDSMPQAFHGKSKSLDYTMPEKHNVLTTKTKLPRQAPDLRLIRAMPDPVPIKLNANTSSIENSTSLSTSPGKYETVYARNGTQIYEERPVNAAHTLRTPQSVDELNCESYYSTKTGSICSARSCDDIMMTTRSQQFTKIRQHQASFDDVSLLGDAPPPPPRTRYKTRNECNDNDDYVFLAPQVPTSKRLTKKPKKSSSHKLNYSKEPNELLSYKLSPKVFGVAKPISASNENLSSAKRRLSIGNDDSKENCDKKNVCCVKKRDFNLWGSLQDLEILNKLSDNRQGADRTTKKDFLDNAYSEPDLTVRLLFLS